MNGGVALGVGAGAVAISIMLGGPARAAASTDGQQEMRLLAEARAASASDALFKIRGIETQALRSPHADAQRNGAILTLRLTSGKTMRFADRPACRDPSQEAKCQTYGLIAHARRYGAFVIAKLYYESAEYLLVDDRTGAAVTLRAFPRFSPSGKHILTLLMNDEQLGFAVQLWRHDGHKFALDWQGAPYATGAYTSYKLIRWANEDRIELESENDFDRAKAQTTKAFTLKHTGRGWEIIPAR